MAIHLRPLVFVAVALTALPSVVRAQQTVSIQSSIPSRGWLGLRWRLDPSFVIRSGEGRGRAANPPTVSFVEPGSPAAAAGLQTGDAILELNGVDARGIPLFVSREPGTQYLLRIRRGNLEREARLTVGYAPLAAGGGAARAALRAAPAAGPRRR